MHATAKNARWETRLAQTASSMLAGEVPHQLLMSVMTSEVPDTLSTQGCDPSPDERGMQFVAAVLFWAPGGDVQQAEY